MFEILPHKTKKTLILLAVFSGTAILINLIILKIFNQNSPYRAEHGLIGIIILMAFVFTFVGVNTSRSKIVSLFLLSLIPCYFGTVFPDLDITFLGIGGHRNPLFHSGSLFFVMLFFARRFHSFMLAAVITAFGIGLGSHLIWDFFDHADVRWIPGGTLDRLWLSVNGVLCLVLAKVFMSSRFK